MIDSTNEKASGQTGIAGLDRTLNAIFMYTLGAAGVAMGEQYEI